MRHNIRLRKGFTLVDIIVSTIILLIAITALFTGFIYTANLRVGMEDELEISIKALSWLENVRTGYTSATRYNNLTAQADIDLNDGSSILPEDYNNWIVANESSIDIENPGDGTKGVFYTVEENVDLGSGVNFKKITVEAIWEQLEG